MAADALRTLIDAVQRLSRAEALVDVQRIVRSAARRLAQADGATFVLREDGHCRYADEDAIGSLWKGQRFPLRTCISGWAMLNRKPVVIADVFADPRIPHAAYRPTFVRSLAMVPIRTMDPIGAIGLYWAKRHVASEQELGLAQALADSAALALQHVRVSDRFARAHGVGDAGMRDPAETDPLTGLPTRAAAERALADTLRPREQPVCVVLMNIDAARGSAAGDAHLRRAAVTWRAQLRPGDLLARFGSEEFAIVLTRCDRSAAAAIAGRLRAATLDGWAASFGIAWWDGEEPADGLVCRADEALYRAKRDGRERVAFAG